MGKRKYEIQNCPNLQKLENIVQLESHNLLEQTNQSQHLDPQVKENKIQNQVRQTINYLKSVNP